MLITINDYLSGGAIYETEAANLREAMERAAKTDVILCYADLAQADLEGANLENLELHGANLAGANLKDADLTGVGLGGVNLEGANLAATNLSRIKADLFAILDTAPSEVDGVLVALRGGRINGSAYEGACRCLVGTIAGLRGVSPWGMPDLCPNVDRPAERWFLAIRAGDTPATNPVAAITEGWLVEWLAANE